MKKEETTLTLEEITKIHQRDEATLLGIDRTHSEIRGEVRELFLDYFNNRMVELGLECEIASGAYYCLNAKIGMYLTEPTIKLPSTNEFTNSKSYSDLQRFDKTYGPVIRQVLNDFEEQYKIRVQRNHIHHGDNFSEVN